jgi:hypothetical protein
MGTDNGSTTCFFRKVPRAALANIDFPRKANRFSFAKGIFAAVLFGELGNRGKFLGWGSQGRESMIQARDDGARP